MDFTLIFGNAGMPSPSLSTQCSHHVHEFSKMRVKTIPLKGGHHRQLDNQLKGPMDNDKDCRVGRLTKSADEC